MLDNNNNLIVQYLNNLSRPTPPASTSSVSSTGINPLKSDKIEDKLAFLEMYTDMKSVTEDTDADTGCYLEQGSINGQQAMWKTAGRYLGNNKFAIYREGIIGDKKLFLIYQKGHKAPKGTKRLEFTGEYNNKPIDLVLEYPTEKNSIKKFWNETIKNKMYIPENLTIKGKFDNRPYELNLPNALVPRDNDEKDIITSMLSISGYAPAVMGGKIIGISAGNRRAKSCEEKSQSRKEFWHDPLVTMAIGAIVIPSATALLKHSGNSIIKGATAVWSGIKNLFGRVKP